MSIGDVIFLVTLLLCILVLLLEMWSSYAYNPKNIVLEMFKALGINVQEDWGI